ncbi:hypothetical protein LPMP_340740 [Leishmania panamensis]|uniref:Uncharacterized protein n=1 Tax=Leishmania panamensis TaxID=5679 RepID=A0A088S2E2_LEIPA|nr:hypothetical protein LPMP_340740 [Leishmania panamensis]AIO01700.1 hypothetical protein LPMP_340740 [Leishmania panamensis]
MVTPLSGVLYVASPSPSANNSTANFAASTASVSHHPWSTHGAVVNGISFSPLSLSSVPWVSAPVAPSPVLVDAQGTGSPATALATRAVERAAPSNGVSSVATDGLSTSSPSSGFNLGNNSPPHFPLATGFAAYVAAAPLGAEELTGAETRKWRAVSESPLGSAARQQPSPHHGNSLAPQDPRIPSQEGPAATLPFAAHDAGYTPGSANRKRAVDTSTTEGGAASFLSITTSNATATMASDVARPHSSTPGTHSSVGAESPPTSIAARNNGEAKGEVNCEEPVQTTNTNAEDWLQMQLSSDGSALDQCNSAILPLPRLQLIDSKNRNTLETPTCPFDGGRDAGGTPVVSVGSPTTHPNPIANDYISFRSDNSSPLSSLAKSSVGECEMDYRRGSAAATAHEAQLNTSCDTERVSSSRVGRLTAQSEALVSFATGTQSSPSRQPGTSAAGAVMCKATAAHQLASTSAPDAWAVPLSANMAPVQNSEPRSFTHQRSSGYRTSGSNDENGKPGHDAAATTHSPSDVATGTAARPLSPALSPCDKKSGTPAVLTEWSIDSLPTSACTRRVPESKDDDKYVSGHATMLAPTSVTSSRLQFQSAGSMNYDEASEVLMEPCSINSPLRKETSSSMIVSGAREGGGAGSANGIESNLLGTSQPLSAQRRTCADAMTSTPAANPATRLSLSESGVQEKAGDLSGFTSTRASSDGLPPTSTWTTAASGNRPIPGGAEQQPQRDSVVPNNGVSSASRSLHRDTGQLSVDSGDGNGLLNTPQGFDRSLLVDSSTALAQQQPRYVVLDGVVTENDDMWGELTSSAPAPAAHPPTKPTVDALTRHVTFASPATTLFVEPPPSSWADREYFSPDYARMEYKDSEDGSPSEQQQQQQQQLADVPLVNEEEDEVLRSVPRFRFRHGSVRAQALSPLPGVAVQLRAPAWEAWSCGSSGMRRKMSAVDSNEVARTESCATHTQQQAEPTELVPPQGSEETAETGSATAGKAQQVFFTKELLASRAALMQSRRAGVQAAGSTNDATAATASRLLPGPEASSVSLLRPPPAATGSSGGDGGSALRIHLAPPSAAANTISLALPGFAAPVTSTPTATRHDNKVTQASSSPSPDQKDAFRDADGNDGFGEWVQPPRRAASECPLPETVASPNAPQVLTRERCTQLLASLGRGSALVMQSAASCEVDTVRVEDVLRNVFGDRAAVSDSLHGKPPPDASPEPISADGASPDDPLAPAESLSTMKRVLEALSFTSLTSRVPEVSPTSNDAVVPPILFDPHMGGQSFAASAGIAYLAGASASTDRKGPVQAVGRTAPSASAEMAALQEVDVKDGEDASVLLTRERLFPLSAHGASSLRRDAAMLSVASFLGSRRLPDALTAAQWTERDVLLAVLQEECRMAQENSAAETESLQDVLKTVCS